jgi:DNA-binding NtrC family response regulator
VKVSCATLSKEIIESELFGHEKGAFTSASREKIGRFEYADKGTIFLDEIDDTTTELQVKLLRAIEEQVFERVGSSTPIKVDVRVIAATKVNLREQAEKGLFRKDLFYRLNVMPIYIPPLRERKDDIPLLLEHFLKNPDGTSSRIRIDPIAMDILNSYSWPGNVRELRNLVERLKNTKGEGVVTLFDLPEEIRLVSLASAENRDSTFHDAMNRVERKFLLEAMRACGGNKSRAARALVLRLSTFRDKLAKHNLQELTF